MLVWQEWTGIAAEWDALVLQLADFTVYQSHAWGVHRATFGWQPLRLIGLRDAQVVAVAQVLVRRYPLGIGIAWIPGGPLGNVQTWGGDLQRAIRRHSGLRFFYCRLNALGARTDAVDTALNANGWIKTSQPLLSGMSLEYSPSLPEEQRMQMCSGNWRHNLRRSFKRNLSTSVWLSPDPNEMMQAYASMQELKNLAAQTSKEEIESLLSAFGKNCLIVRCDDEQGNLLALRGALIMGSKAWDMFAVANPAGRKVYASHSAFWALMNQCAQLGVEWYDMSGADPVNNRGVYDFKKGSGATDVTQVGEWEFAYPSLLRKPVSYLIGRRGRA
jgi:lipid II:glycine glycyltransferase (peptidoglycan interpeptide bridge formation enzyme)